MSSNMADPLADVYALRSHADSICATLPISGEACQDRNPCARLARLILSCTADSQHAAGENSASLDGLRTGSPSSPPPRSIHPTVRRLLRSPRLSGPGPHNSHSAAAFVPLMFSISAIDWNSLTYS